MDFDLDDVYLPTTKEKEMRDDSTEIFDKHGKKFIAFLEEDSDHNSKVWSVFTSSRSSLPKKGDLVVYFPQGHLEYEKPPYDLIDLKGDPGQLLPVPGPPGQPPREEVRTYDLQPQIICRVEHVQLMIMEANDEIYANITLHPEPEVNSEEKELEQSDEIEDGSSVTISTPSVFCKILYKLSETIKSLSFPHKAAIELFCLDNESMDLQNEVIAKDFHGNEWKFPLIRDKKGNWLLGWREFARAKNVQEGETVVFLREKDTKLMRVGIKRIYSAFDPFGIANYDSLSAVAGAILKKSIFSVMYWRMSCEDFVIPYHKYMKSITRPGFIGAKVRHRYSLTRATGEVTEMADLDPKNWPNSTWKCLTVRGERDFSRGIPSPIVFLDFHCSPTFRVSPWEIVFDDSHSSSTFDSSLKLKRPWTSQQDNSSPMPHLEKHKDLLSDEAIKSKKQKHVQEPVSIHCEADTTNHPFDIQKQTPALQTTNYKELKISNCSVDDLWRHLKENHSYEYLEFDSCSFPSSTRIPTPITIKKLKITNCVDTEHVFTVLMDPNLSVESLEIDSCSSFNSMSTGGIPATLRQLKIVNCMNLNSLSESFETEKSPSIDERVHYSKAEILELRKLEIQNCQKLESLPKGMHKLRNLDLLSINDCCSLEYFPEGGFPITCLTSLSISGCENLKCLPNKLHKVTSLQNLSISGCPSLMFFPEGGLPPNLVSLRIIDCESLFSISQWELHKLKHLREYSFSCGCSDSGE